MPNPWPEFSKLPRGAAAALAALHLSEPRLDGLAALNEREWREALDFADRSQLTLILRGVARDTMPAGVRERVDRNAADNRERLRRTEELYQAIAQRFAAAGIEFVALKGLTHCRWTGIAAEARAQYDIDVLSPPDRVEAARDVLLALGFEPIEGLEKLPTDHLPHMIRKTGWEWRGNFFDPEMPLAVEPHFRFWDPGTELLAAPGVEEFWTRRVAGEIPVLHPADALGYAALHLLKHILRGSARPLHVYEVAQMLDRRAEEEDFWEEWRWLHSPGVRRLEGVCFRFAAEWFGCRLPSVLDPLPAATLAWFEDFALEPAAAPFTASKAELWLHLSLVPRFPDRLRIARRRLLPVNLPGAVDAVHIPEGSLTWRRRVLKQARRFAFIGSRLRHHTVSLGPTAAAGIQMWGRLSARGGWFARCLRPRVVPTRRTDSPPQGNSLPHKFSGPFWIFLAVAIAFNFGLFIFSLLYNLFLSDLGFREDFLGVVNGASRIGSLAGTIPAAFLARRYGLRACLLATIAATSIIEVGRAAIGAQMPLAALAFASGCVFSLWAVIMSPMIAGTVAEERRPAAYSFFFACMFANGIVANWVGGQLPVWMHGKRPVLIFSAALSAAALIPALALTTGARPNPGARVYPRSRFLLAFLIPFAAWHLATGAFNPFNNIYFARRGFSVAAIGKIFSVAQGVQVGAVLLAPSIIRRAGLVMGIVWMAGATALSLGGMAAGASGTAAILGYMAYMSFQWMSEPALNSLLMNHVEERERSGASAVTFLVAFGAQALAALAAGRLFVAFDYGPVLAGAAVLAGLAAAMFSRLSNTSR